MGCNGADAACPPNEREKRSVSTGVHIAHCSMELPSALHRVLSVVG